MRGSDGMAPDWLLFCPQGPQMGPMASIASFTVTSQVHWWALMLLKRLNLANNIHQL